MIKENINKTRIKHTEKWLYFDGEKLTDMIESIEFVDLHKQHKKEGFFFTLKLKDRSKHGYLKPYKEFEELFKKHIFNERYENAHFDFIEWDNDEVILILGDGIYISSAWINLFNKKEVLDFFKLGA